MLFTGKLIMVVDDSYTIRHQVKMLLRKYEIIVLEAHNKVSMLNQLHYNGKLVDLIIMDLGLKDTTGFDLMDLLQKSPAYKDIPIIVLTGDATKNTVIEAASSFTIEHYAIKPIDPIDLSNKVLTVLERNHFSIRPKIKPHSQKYFEEHKEISPQKASISKANTNTSSKGMHINPADISKR